MKRCALALVATLIAFQSQRPKKMEIEIEEVILVLWSSALSMHFLQAKSCSRGRRDTDLARRLLMLAGLLLLGGYDPFSTHLRSPGEGHYRMRVGGNHRLKGDHMVFQFPNSWS